MNFSKQDFDYIKKTILSAGQLLLKSRSDIVVKAKSNVEIVTDSDLEVNNFVINELQSRFKDYGFSTEEEAEIVGKVSKRFIIDPLDGTTKFVWGSSGYSISLAIEEEGGLVFGMILDPEHDELFYATKGMGAFRNGQRITSSKLVDIDNALIACDWGNADEKRKEGIKYFRKLILPKMVSRRVVPQFSPANDLARIAEGRIHALVCNDTWIEDHSAGSLILAEAGGYITNFYDREKFLHKKHGIIAACNEEIYLKLTELIFG